MIKCPKCGSSNVVVWKEGKKKRMRCNTCGYKK